LISLTSSFEWMDAWFHCEVDPFVYKGIKGSGVFVCRTGANQRLPTPLVLPFSPSGTPGGYGRNHKMAAAHRSFANYHNWYCVPGISLAGEQAGSGAGGFVVSVAEGWVPCPRLPWACWRRVHRHAMVNESHGAGLPVLTVPVPSRTIVDWRLPLGIKRSRKCLSAAQGPIPLVSPSVAS
jgi:hypothetical protein